MDRRELLDRLRELKPWLESQGVVDLRLFGSFARDEAREDSDVDLMCRITRRMGLEPWTKMVALRHRVAHGYTRVDPDVHWNVAQGSLPELARELDTMEAR